MNTKKERPQGESLADIVDKVKNGRVGPGEAKKLLQMILSDIESSDPLTIPIRHDLVNYLTHSIKEILSGNDANKALGLVRRRGKSATIKERNTQIAADVLRLMGQGKKLLDAAGELSREYNSDTKKHDPHSGEYDLHESRIQDIYAEYLTKGMTLLLEERLENNCSKHTHTDTAASVRRMLGNILRFQSYDHPAWDQQASFGTRIKDLPLYFLEFNHTGKDKDTQSVTVTHYAPRRAEMMALAHLIRSCGDNLQVCDIGCGNGFLGSLLAREGVKVFGIDDRSYKQPQIPNFFDSECYRVIETSLADLDIPFDVALCAWIEPNANLTPLIVDTKPALIIHILSPDRQTDGTPTTGTQSAYTRPEDYYPVAAWRTELPQDYFLPLTRIVSANLESNSRKTGSVFIYARRDIRPLTFVSPRSFSDWYDWDHERHFIDGLRRGLGLPPSTLAELV